MTRTARTQASGEVGMAAGQVLESATELSREAETLRSEVTRFLAGVPVHLPRGPAGVRAEAAALVVALLPRPAHASYQPAKVLTFAGWYSLCLARRRPGPTRRAIPPGESHNFRRAVSYRSPGRAAGMRRAVAAALLPVLAGCAAPPPPSPPAHAACEGLRGAGAVTADLYFGRTSQGRPVTDATWRGFLAEVVTPRFPDGLTVLDGRGQWRRRDNGRVVSEPATMVRIVTDRGPETVRRLEEIRAEYRARFAQES